MSSRMKNLYNNVYKGMKHKKEGGYMEKVIEVKNLYKLYRVGDEVVRALDIRASSARLSELPDLVNRPF